MFIVLKMRRYRFRKEVNEELRARALLESEVFGSINWVKDIDSFEASQALRKIIGRLSLDEVRVLYPKIARSPDPLGVFIHEALMSKDFDTAFKSKWLGIFATRHNLRDEKF